MLEYFTVEYFTRGNNTEDFELYNKYQSYDIVTLLSGLIALTISFLTAKLAYDCNKKANTASKVLVSVFAFLFSWSYLLYYFVWHFLLQNKC